MDEGHRNLRETDSYAYTIAKYSLRSDLRVCNHALWWFVGAPGLQHYPEFKAVQCTLLLSGVDLECITRDAHWQRRTAQEGIARPGVGGARC